MKSKYDLFVDYSLYGIDAINAMYDEINKFVIDNPVKYKAKEDG